MAKKQTESTVNPLVADEIVVDQESINQKTGLRNDTKKKPSASQPTDEMNFLTSATTVLKTRH